MEQVSEVTDFLESCHIKKKAFYG